MPHQPQEKKSDNELVFESIFYSSLDSIAINHGINGQQLVYHDIFPDRVKYLTLQGVLNANKDVKTKKLDIVRQLIDILDDSVHLYINETQTAKYSFYYKAESIEKNIAFDSPNFFGSINLSNVVIADDKKLAGYYMAIQCGSECSAGYVVLAQQSFSRWQIKEIIRIWGS